jgi:hypothetical protein
MRCLFLSLTVLVTLSPVNLLDLGDGTAAAAGRTKSGRAPTRRVYEVKPPESTASSGDAEKASAPPQRGPTRLDFDDRLIQGQTNTSGAVYLYDRKELKVRSMVGKRESFREEIVKTVYDQ